MLQFNNIAHEEECVEDSREVAVHPLQLDDVASYRVEDVQHLLQQYQQSELSYHEIGRRNSLNKIRQRWPLLAELDETN